MNPVIALVGRPNVGKSTLFNRLTRTRDALVADYPGLTRDRQYGSGEFEERTFILIDTGGLSGNQASIDEYMATQTWAAIDEADALLFLVDGREGLTAADEQIAQRLRRTNKPIYLAINKTDGLDPSQASAEFYQLGFECVSAIAATQGRNINGLLRQILLAFPLDKIEQQISKAHPGIRIAFVGRPNVGKSTLVNRILGEERVVAFDQPGTTRDSIFIPFERDGQEYTLIDTAGIRRRARVKETVEKFSIIKAIQAINQAHVVILVLDAQDNIADQDAHLIGLTLEAGRALVLAINKWDNLGLDQRALIRKQLELKLSFLDFAERHFISALHGTGVGHLYTSVKAAYQSTMLKVSTARLTRILETAVTMHQPPLVQGRRIKLRYAHQGGSNPFRLVIHGNQTKRIPGSYKRYLMNYFRETLKFKGCPIHLEFKTSDNPYKNRRNKLTPRQRYEKQREERQQSKVSRPK